MENKAQASHILLYALTAVIAAMVLIFGYKAIIAMKGSTDKITSMNFRADFSKDVDLGSSYGAVKTQRYHVPPEYDEICLIDKGMSPDDDASFDKSKYPLIYDSWKTKAPANVFLIPDGEPFQVTNLTFASNGHVCMPLSNGYFTVKLRGKGVNTEIEPAIS